MKNHQMLVFCFMLKIEFIDAVGLTHRVVQGFLKFFQNDSLVRALSNHTT